MTDTIRSLLAEASELEAAAREQLQSAQADITALLVLLTRHRDRLTMLERATVGAISERHGHVVPTSTSTPTSISTSEHLMRSTSRLDDPLAGLTPEQRAACEAELAMMRQGR